MSLGTPDKLRSLQRKLYRKAKAEPAFRFYMLYDKVCRDDILSHAYALCRSNGGASGVDGVTFGVIEASGLETWLAALREDLVLKTYPPAEDGEALRRLSPSGRQHFKKFEVVFANVVMLKGAPAQCLVAGIVVAVSGGLASAPIVDLSEQRPSWPPSSRSIPSGFSASSETFGLA